MCTNNCELNYNRLHDLDPETPRSSPLMLGIAACEFFADSGICALPETVQIIGQVHGPLVGGQQLDQQGNLAVGNNQL